MSHLRQRLHLCILLVRSSRLVNFLRGFWRLFICMMLIGWTLFQYEQIQQKTFPKESRTLYNVDGEFLNYIVIPLDRETLHRTFLKTVVNEQTLFGKEFSTVKHIDIENSTIKFLYRKQEPPSYYNFLTNKSIPVNNKPYTKYTDYFEYLKTPTWYCKRLARIGGNIHCDDTGDDRNMDGQKLICLDPEMQIPLTKDTESCLVLSFGVSSETSFDESILNMNCEVHMFDILNYSNPHLENKKYLHFHNTGILNKETYITHQTENFTVHVDTLENLIVKLGLQKRLINILKMDIETYEWDVFEEVLEGQYLNAFGQIALEVHAVRLASISDEEERNKMASRWLNILQRLEKAGFQKVTYWDNRQPMYLIKDKNLNFYETSGEILLVNTNWYSAEMRTNGRNDGYNFHFL